ncbi:hypothetical protein HPT27_09680 [Permianibacter sp. IMCC34836]|uniref:hypothetical protein n=1 Tax=Permianibacter fluminis TaxID=2738515 RepID=UPI0015524CEF|nr:hypothetical protein [Permianibacter fluminis]NQD37297.1 hypothetical protein [Permianibacter fluminis]
MSVVNTMLRELADRQQAMPTLASVDVLPVKKAAEAQVRWPWWLGAVVLLAGSILFWRWQQQNPATGINQASAALTQPFPADSTNTALHADVANAPANNSERADAAIPVTTIPATPVKPTPLTAKPITEQQPIASASTSANKTKAGASKPASIGWELVEAENPELTVALPIADREADIGDVVETVAITDPFASQQTPRQQTASPAPAPSVFERQPAQQSLPEQLVQWRQQARRALAVGDWRGADAAVRSGLQLQPDDSELQVLQLQIEAQQAPLAARAHAQALLHAKPDNWSVRQWLGTEFLQQQQFAAALTVLQQQPPTMIEAPDYHAVLALAEQQTGAHAAAAARYRGLLNLQPEHGRHYAGLALSLEPLGDNAGALAAWRAALRDPQLPTAVAQFGRQRLQQLSSAVANAAAPAPATTDSSSQVTP